MGTGLLFKILFETAMAVVFYRIALYWFHPEMYISDKQNEQTTIFRRLFGLNTDITPKPHKFAGCSFLVLAGLIILFILFDMFFFIHSIL